MKKFVELIQRVHKERFSVVMNKIAAEKIPVAFLSLAPLAQAIQIVNNLRANGLNITTLITLDSPPPPDLKIDFNIIHISKAWTVYPFPEYLFLTEDIYDNATSRFALKYLPTCNVINLNAGNNEHIYQTFMENLTNLQGVYESLIDEESKRAFCGYWLGRISGKFGEFVYADMEQYLSAGFIPKSGGIVIEAGAYDGGTAAILSDFGYKVYTFEMDKISFEKAKKLSLTKNFVVENMGLGSYNHEMKYTPTGGQGNKLKNSGSEIAKVVSIDSYVRENKISRVDFIKLDVEGAELDVLQGAKAVISLYKPILALSAYHKLDDFWTLMNFVKSIRPDYEFAMRHYPISSEAEFHENLYDRFYAMGLEPDRRMFSDCCLLAR